MTKTFEVRERSENCYALLASEMSMLRTAAVAGCSASALLAVGLIVYAILSDGDAAVLARAMVALAAMSALMHMHVLALLAIVLRQSRPRP